VDSFPLRDRECALLTGYDQKAYPFLPLDRFAKLLQAILDDNFSNKISLMHVFAHRRWLCQIRVNDYLMKEGSHD
jgi:hypothetical protein